MMQRYLKLKYVCLLAAVALLCAAATAQAAWKAQSAPTTEQIRAIDGCAENKILAVGNAATILLYNGTAWQKVNTAHLPDETLYGVWWASETEAFVAGDNGLILHFDGTAWTTMNSGTTNRLRNIWGAAANDVFAVGDTGTILHYDGSTWSAMTSPIALTIQSAWGNSGTDVYAVGGESASDTAPARSFILHYDGSQWTLQKELTSPERFHEVWGVGSTVFTAGEAGTILFTDTAGADWTQMSSKTAETFRGLWGTALNNVYAVGDYGTIMRYDGTAWSPESSGVTRRLFGIWGSSADSIYVIGDTAGIVLHYTPGDTDPPECPFIEAVADTEDLQLLRAARDRQLSSLSGICLVTLFYGTAAETARIARDTPALRNKIEQLVTQNRPLLQSLADGKSGHFTRSTLMAIESICKELQAAGSRRLALVLAGLRYGLKHGWLLNILDITVE